MITTHSPIFIDVSKDYTTIIRVDKNENYETRIFSTEKAGFEEGDRERLKMIRACNPYVNEFFFADKVVLVEGDTEQTVLNMIKSDKSQYSTVSVVNCHGKANIPMFQKILNHFGINYIVIHDIDSPRSKRDGKWIKNAMWSINHKIFVEEIQPKAFLLENVKGLLSAPLKHRPLSERVNEYPPLEKEEQNGSALEYLLECFKSYNIKYQVINSADYGVPQKRERVFFVGIRKDLDKEFEFPVATHGIGKKHL